MFSLMGAVCDMIENLYDWAAEETDKTKRFCKSFIAGFIDGWEYGCLIIGNFVCIGGLIFMVAKPYLKKKYPLDD